MTNRSEKIKVGISSCLLGNRVRYDGGHKRDTNIIETLGEYFDFISFCPEAETGMGVPRAPMHLVRRGKKILALKIDNHADDFTQQLENFSQEKHREISELCGFILKKSSPSCGMQAVCVYQDNDAAEIFEETGKGIFARSFKKQFPLLPLEEEGSLRKPVLRDNFIERIFDYHKLKLKSDFK